MHKIEISPHTFSAPIGTAVVILTVVACLVTISANAQQVDESSELEVQATTAASAVWTLRNEIPGTARPTQDPSDARVAWLLETAANLLAQIAAREANDQDASATWDDVRRVGRLLNAAYETAKEIGRYPDATALDEISLALADFSAKLEASDRLAP